MKVQHVMKNKHQAGRVGTTRGGAKQIPIEFLDGAVAPAKAKAAVAKVKPNIGGWYDLPKVQVPSYGMDNYRQVAQEMGMSFSDFIAHAMWLVSFREKQQKFARQRHAYKAIIAAQIPSEN
jgi:hypothetical protein